MRVNSLTITPDMLCYVGRRISNKPLCEKIRCTVIRHVFGTSQLRKSQSTQKYIMTSRVNVSRFIVTPPPPVCVCVTLTTAAYRAGLIPLRSADGFQYKA